MVQEVGASPETDQIAYANPGANPQTIGRITPPGDALTSPTPMKDPFGVALRERQRLVVRPVRLQQPRPADRERHLHRARRPASRLRAQVSDDGSAGHPLGRPADDQPGRSRHGRRGARTRPRCRRRSTRRRRASRRARRAPRRPSSSPRRRAAAGFECALKRKGKKNGKEKKLAEFAACASPKKYKKLRKGKYTFLVRATLMGAVDATPAEARAEGQEEEAEEVARLTIRGRRAPTTRCQPFRTRITQLPPAALQCAIHGSAPAAAEYECCVSGRFCVSFRELKPMPSLPRRGERGNHAFLGANSPPATGEGELLISPARQLTP